MIENKLVAVVVPAYNEEQQISVVIDTMPNFVDRIIIVNDCSKDGTEDVVKKHILANNVKTVKIKKNPVVIAPTFFNRADVIELEMLQEEEQYYPKHEIYNDNEEDRIVLINNMENAKVGGGDCCRL